MRVRPWTFLLAAVLVLGGSHAARAETPEQIFNRGNAAYEAGMFQEAAEAYRTVARYGIRDARVEYNLGNAEFKLGRLGEAILHYRRAQRLDPTDPDIRANLELVDSYCLDQVPVERPIAPLRWVRALQDGLGPDRQAWVALVLFWTIGGLVGWWTSRPGGWTAGAGWTATALALMLALTVASWTATYHRLEGQALAVVLDETVEVLAGPGDSHAALATVHEGLTVEIRGERGEWLQAGLPNGLNGWIAKDKLGRV